MASQQANIDFAEQFATIEAQNSRLTEMIKMLIRKGAEDQERMERLEDQLDELQRDQKTISRLGSVEGKNEGPAEPIEVSLGDDDSVDAEDEDEQSEEQVQAQEIVETKEEAMSDDAESVIIASKYEDNDSLCEGDSIYDDELEECKSGQISGDFNIGDEFEVASTVAESVLNFDTTLASELGAGMQEYLETPTSRQVETPFHDFGSTGTTMQMKWVKTCNSQFLDKYVDTVKLGELLSNGPGAEKLVQLMKELIQYDAKDASPVWRHELRGFEKKVGNMSERMHKMYEVGHKLVEAGRAFSEASKAFSGEIKSFYDLCDEGEVHVQELLGTIPKAYERYGNLIDALCDSLQDDLLQKIQKDAIVSVERVAHETKKLDSMHKALEEQTGEFLSVKKPKRKARDELISNTIKYENQRKRCVALINSILIGKRMEMIETLSTGFYSMLSYFASGYDGMHDFVDVTESARALAVSRRQAHDAYSLVHYSPNDIDIEQYLYEQKQHEQTIDESVSDACYSGYLWKRSGGLKKRQWKRRWFELKDGQISYYRDPDNLEPEHVCLTKICEIKVVKGGRRYVFQIKSPNTKKFRLQAESRSERDRWLRAIDASKRNKARYAPKEPKRKNKDGAKEDHFVVVNKADQIRQKNLLCADCSAKKPDWVSVAFGVVVCDACIGIHRGFGVKTTRTMSLSSDQIPKGVLNLFLKFSNVESNKMWEATLEEHNAMGLPLEEQKRNEAIKPHYTYASPEQRSAFINSKYIEMEFIDRVELKQRLLPNGMEVEDMFTAFQIAVGSNVLNNVLRAKILNPNFSEYLNSHRNILKVAVTSGSELTLEYLLQSGLRIKDEEEYEKLMNLAGRLSEAPNVAQKRKKLDKREDLMKTKKIHRQAMAMKLAQEEADRIIAVLQEHTP